MSRLRNAISFIKPSFVAVGCALAFGFVYLSTMPTTNVGYADSDEMLSVGYHLGIAHPPGYPLYILLLYPFLHLPLKGWSVAAKGHLLSVVLGMITLYLIYLSVYRLLTLINTSKRKTNQPSILLEFISLISTASLGVSHLFWLYSTIAEKYALLGTLATASVYCMVRLMAEKKLTGHIKWLFLAAFLVGLTASHHVVGAVLLFPFLYLLYEWRQQISPRYGIIIAVLVGSGLLLPNVLLIPLNQRVVPVSWHFDQSFSGWWGQVSRADFYGEAYAKNTQVKSMLNNLDINKGFLSLIEYAKLTLSGFGWYLVIPLVFFIHRLSTKPTQSGRLAALFFIAGGLLVVFLLQWSDDWGTQGTIMRQWYLGHILLVPIIALGWHELYQRLLKIKHILSYNEFFIWALSLIPVSLLGYQLYRNYPLLQMKKLTQVEERYSAMLNTFTPNSLVTCYSDTACFSLLYEQTVNGKRPDIDIVPLQYQLVQNTLTKPGMRGFNYPTNPYLLADIVTWNMRYRPVYAVELSGYYYQFFGMDIPFMYYVPQGYYGELRTSLSKNYSFKPDYALSSQWLKVPLSPLDPYRSHLATVAARDHLTNAQTFIKMDERFKALDELKLATNIFYRFTPREKEQIEGIRTNIEQMLPAKAFLLGSKVASADTLLTYIPDLLAKNQRGKALRAVQGAVLIDPTNLKARLTLADFYRQMGDSFFARLEYLHVIRLDPQNKEANAALSQL